MQQTILHFLSKLIPPQKDDQVSPEVLLRFEPKFKKIYRWHGVLGFLLIFFPALVLYGLSPWIEKWWYPAPADAVYALYPDKGVLGAATGMILGIALAMPLSTAIVRFFTDPKLAQLYEYWYDRRPQHHLNSRVFSRGLMVLFLPLALVCALFFRTQYTVVTQNKLIRSSHWGFSRETLPLQEITSIETRYGKIAPNGNYRHGFRYRLHFKAATPWESLFFSGSTASGHLECRKMIEFLLEKTGLEMTDVETPPG
jgi:hypothetical protein